MTIGIFFGSTTGNTGDVANMIYQQMADLANKPIDIETLKPSDILNHDTLILGIPTWNVGEMQKDWEELGPALAHYDLRGKTVALFGCGDQEGYPDTFGDALGILWEMLEPRGAKLVGRWPTEGYQFDDSRGVRDGMFLGLIVDQENQSELTEARVQRWTENLRSEIAT